MPDTLGPDLPPSSILPDLSPSSSRSRGPLYLEGWDLATLGGQRLPGICRLTRGGVKLKLDRKPKAGADGSLPTTHGLDLGEFEVEVTCWTEEQRAKLAEICRQILPQPGVKQKPLSLDHPQLRHLGSVINVQVIGAGIAQITEPGKTRLPIQLLHWLAPPKGKTATNTAKAAVRNRQADATKALAPTNPAPSTQAGVGAP